MKKIVILFTLALFVSSPIYAHKDVLVTKKYKNVTVNIVTGYYYEEINKALIIGEYVQSLSDRLNFKDSITIFFRHKYIKSSDINKFTLEKSFDGENSNYLLIYESEEYNYFETLNLLEAIFKNQIQEGEENSYSFEKKESSSLVKEILSQKIYRPSYVDELLANNNISYYVKNGKHYIFTLKKRKEKVLLTLDSIYQFSNININSSLVFSSKSSFYYVKEDNSNKLQEINFDSEDFIIPYEVQPYSKDCIMIEMPNLYNKEKAKSIIFNIATNKVVVMGNGSN